jgi:hypothetical protein
MMPVDLACDVLAAGGGLADPAEVAERWRDLPDALLNRVGWPGPAGMTSNGPAIPV